MHELCPSGVVDRSVIADLFQAQGAIVYHRVQQCTEAQGMICVSGEGPYIPARQLSDNSP
jgi:hypothetical protein